MSVNKINNGSTLFKAVIIFSRILLTVCVIWCVVFIFSNSLQIAEVSSEISGRFTALLNRIFSYLPWEIVLTEGLVRKLAHFAEFTLLGFLSTLCLFSYTKKLIAFSPWPLLFGLFIAVCDESIQKFVPGRTGQMKDVLIDFSGVCCGTVTAIVFAFFVYHILCFVRHRKQSFI